MKFLIFLLVIGCSSSIKKMRGRKAINLENNKNEKLKVTSQIDTKSSIENYKLINIYFMNLSKNWIRIKNINVIEVDKDQFFKVIVKNDLKDWLKSLELNESLRKEFNEENKHQSLNRKYMEDEYALAKFSIPSGMQIERWLLLQASQKSQWMIIEIELISGDKIKYKVLINE